MKNEKRNRYLSWILYMLVLILILTFLTGHLPAVPVLIGSGSMEPEISVGDIVILYHTAVETLEPGDIIAYRDSSCTVVHRIVAEEGGSFITQGDANNVSDLHPVMSGQIQGKVLCTIPFVGRPILWLREKLS